MICIFSKKIIVFWLSKAKFGIRDYQEIDAKSSHTMQQGANQSKTDLDIWCKICPKFFMSCPYDSRTQPWWKSCLLDGLVRTNRARPWQPNCQKGLEWLCWLVFCYYMGTNFFKNWILFCLNQYLNGVGERLLKNLLTEN